MLKTTSINTQDKEQQKLLKEKERELVKFNKLREQDPNHKISYHEERSICSSYKA